jgi:hypothetical protein
MCVFVWETFVNGMECKENTHTQTEKKMGENADRSNGAASLQSSHFLFFFFSPRLLSPSFGNVYASRVNPLTRRRDRWSGLKHAAFLSCSPPLFEVLCRIVFGYICTCKK